MYSVSIMIITTIPLIPSYCKLPFWLWLPLSRNNTHREKSGVFPAFIHASSLLYFSVICDALQRKSDVCTWAPLKNTKRILAIFPEVFCLTLITSNRECFYANGFCERKQLFPTPKRMKTLAKSRPHIRLIEKDLSRFIFRNYCNLVLTQLP